MPVQCGCPITGRLLPSLLLACACCAVLRHLDPPAAPPSPPPPTSPPSLPSLLPCSGTNENGDIVGPQRPSATINCSMGCTYGKLWGTGVYTSDSWICVAAVQAGVLTSAGGPVTVYYAPGQGSYLGGCTGQGRGPAGWRRAWLLLPVPAVLSGSRPRWPAGTPCIKCPPNQAQTPVDITCVCCREQRQRGLIIFVGQLVLLLDLHSTLPTISLPAIESPSHPAAAAFTHITVPAATTTTTTPTHTHTPQ